MKRRILIVSAAFALLTAWAPHEAGAADQYPLEIDHAFVIPNGAEAGLVAALSQAGFIVDPEPFEFGGGAFSRMVYLDNAYFELHFPDGAAGRPMAAGGDWAKDGNSPFGTGLRRRSGGDEALPFRSTPHTEDWMPKGAVMQVLDDGSASEPGIFVMPKAMSVKSAAARAEWRKDHADDAAKRFDHPNGARIITAVEIVTSEKGYPADALHVEAAHVTFKKGAAPLMTVTMDGGRQGRTLDLRPAAQVVILY